MGLKEKCTEEKILEAAKNVFMKYGFYGAKMQDISNQAGINKALLHYYFRNKEKLFDQVWIYQTYLCGRRDLNPRATSYPFYTL